MPKYMISASYTRKGIEGLRAGGGSARRNAIAATLDGLGGRLEAFYFALGERDVVLIADMPDDEAVVALSLSLTVSGAVETQTTALLTPEQVDEAAKRAVGVGPES
jgi:uncharacterized protein with GYD domain